MYIASQVFGASFVWFSGYVKCENQIASQIFNGLLKHILESVICDSFIALHVYQWIVLRSSTIETFVVTSHHNMNIWIECTLALSKWDL